MILRSITKHVKHQNWLALFLDFVIVVVGVFVGLQVQEWAQEKARQNNEIHYLNRLHTEVQELIKTRNHYDTSRPTYVQHISESIAILSDESNNLELNQIQCDAIVASSFTTVPPADLPTVNELISAGRLNQIQSPSIRQAILDFTQQAERAETLILAMSDTNIELANNHPDLIKLQYTVKSGIEDSVWLDPICDTTAMRKNPSFMNKFNHNAYIYKVYADRAVRPVAQHLAELHAEVDKSLGTKHASSSNDKEVTP